ncbi:hypothetical protein HCN51_30955 [Nonomuraea sp. FMUSA5-5]|uniref:EF-hand domain-containing protein n=1 Tax=Nonomuraea composti TaxID=2720023 RepID=A0ABX1BDG1_9ACTN|nr:hypothetical protein [Nonomuraea sp. FMUSA5-5]NJP93811.1 hypothetical protein [Nonomuraea sp. FMUSA5-5]
MTVAPRPLDGGRPKRGRKVLVTASALLLVVAGLPANAVLVSLIDSGPRTDGIILRGLGTAFGRPGFEIPPQLTDFRRDKLTRRFVQLDTDGDGFLERHDRG